MANVVITGASDGIGRALATIYRKRGATVYAVGRRRFAAIVDAPFAADQYLQCDLSDGHAPQLIAAWLAKHGVTRLDVLIHNAGLGAYGPPAEADPAVTRAVVAVNLRAPIALTHVLLPQILSARGTIVCISSVAAALSTPHYAVYSATKSALEGFARSLRVELGNRARVLVVRPGATRTEFHVRSGVPAGRMAVRRFPAPMRVARGISAAIDRGKPLSTVGTLNRVVAWAGRRMRWLIG
ncbi:MAG: SDR family NAD(P)-dependent oxidoreductase [Oscillochloris sp.]|nr:SDR family NAD(P)-dependent oxidoreductase [Oscillochloris sp.]